jgi:hypothetical protein
MPINDEWPLPPPPAWGNSITQAELNQLRGERDFYKREAKRYRDLYEVAQEEVEKLRRYMT